MEKGSLNSFDLDGWTNFSAASTAVLNVFGARELCLLALSRQARLAKCALLLDLKTRAFINDMAVLKVYKEIYCLFPWEMCVVETLKSQSKDILVCSL